MRDIVAFYPYTSNNNISYSVMRKFAESRYHVVDYLDLKKGLYDLATVRTIYLNWMENILNEDHKQFLKMAKRKHIKIIWVFHNRVPHDALDLGYAVDNIRFLMKICDKIVLYSRDSKKYLIEYDSKMDVRKIYFIPHPNFINDYNSYGDIKERLPLDSDTFVFSVFGLVRPYKNIELIIEAFERLKETYNCVLLIAGSPLNRKYGEKLQALTENRKVVFDFKYINSLEMASYLELSDVLVQPYDIKSSMNSGVMIMAFSYGRTVIVSDIAMTNDFDESLIYKYTYESNQEHIDKLHKMMEKAYLDGRENSRNKGRQLFEIVKEKYSKEKTKEALLNIL